MKILKENDYKEMSICGFPIEQLIDVAKLLRSKNINIDDIKRMTHDIGYITQLMREEQDKVFKSSMENLTKQFNK
jgi:hypothetical protein